ncbi:unnamed protein product, partial [Musa acuminata subsp. burmannicoides]
WYYTGSWLVQYVLTGTGVHMIHKNVQVEEEKEERRRKKEEEAMEKEEKERKKRQGFQSHTMVLYWFLVSPVCPDWYWCTHDTQKCTGGGREGRTKEEEGRRGDGEGRE